MNKRSTEEWKDIFDIALTKFKYNPIDGNFYYRKGLKYKKEGDLAGCINSLGYIVLGVTIDKKCIQIHAHRLAWYSEHKEIPYKIDHKDRCRSNNKSTNIRKCTSSQNAYNSSINVRNTSGVTGVSWDEHSGKWLCLVSLNKKRVCLGIYSDFEEAKDVVTKFRRENHKEFSSC